MFYYKLSENLPLGQGGVIGPLCVKLHVFFSPRLTIGINVLHKLVSVHMLPFC